MFFFSNIKLNLFHTNTNPMSLYEDIMPYSNKYIHAPISNVLYYFVTLGLLVNMPEGLREDPYH